MKKLRTLRFVLISFVFIIFFSVIEVKPSFAQEFTFDHSDCVIRMKNYQETKQKEEKSGLTELGTKARQYLTERNYEVKNLIDNKRLNENELYFTLEIKRPKKKVYTSCVVNIAIKKAKGTIPSNRDQIIYRKSIDRRVPRITLKGQERCKLALRDAFVHIPHCQKIGYTGEKKK